MSWEYVTRKGKKLRRGYTTGTCAAAAAKAAATMLFTGRPVQEVTVTVPAGIMLQLKVHNARCSREEASCSVIKDSGDDPDVTNGMHIFAAVKMKDISGVQVRGGEGVGVVTVPGLPVAVGEAAINPVPRSMITGEVSALLPPGRGAEVTISIPGGAEKAAKTFNPRLGIEGGLSVLGTTGIVEPMSEDAFKEILHMEIRRVLARQPGLMVLVPGNHGLKTARDELGFAENQIVKMSNFAGFALDTVRQYGHRRVIFVGHIAKLFKMAAGIFHTHSRVADARFEIFAAHAALLGAGQDIIQKLHICKSSEEMIDILDTLNITGLYDRFAALVSLRAEEYTAGEVSVETVLFSLKKGILGRG